VPRALLFAERFLCIRPTSMGARSWGFLPCGESRCAVAAHGFGGRSRIGGGEFVLCRSATGWRLFGSAPFHSRNAAAGTAEPASGVKLPKDWTFLRRAPRLRSAMLQLCFLYSILCGAYVLASAWLPAIQSLGPPSSEPLSGAVSGVGMAVGPWPAQLGSRPAPAADWHLRTGY